MTLRGIVARIDSGGRTSGSRGDGRRLGIDRQWVGQNIGEDHGGGRWPRMHEVSLDIIEALIFAD